MRVRVRHPLLAHDRLELAALDHAARRLEVVEDRLEAGEALEPHHLFGQQRAVVARARCGASWAARRGAGRTACVEDIAARIEQRGGLVGRRHDARRTASAASSSGSAGASSGTCTASGGPTCRSTAASATCSSRPAARSRITCCRDTGWVSKQIRDDEDVDEVIELFRLGYERARRVRANAASQARRSARRRRSRREITIPIRRACDEPLAARAAIPTAPLGSITSFRRSNAKRIASTICSSVTVTISSTSLRADLPRQLARARVVCRPSAIVRGTSIAHALAARERLPPVVAGLGLDADDPRARRGPARSSRCRRSARRRRPARRACRTAPASSISSSAAVPCAGHDQRVVVGRHELERRARARARRASASRSPRVAVVGDDLGAVAARRLELRRRRVLRHQDRRVRAEQPRRRARPPARGCPTRTRRTRRPVGQRRDLVVRAAELERAAALQVLRLQRRRARRACASVIGGVRCATPSSTRAAARTSSGADHAIVFRRTPMPSISSSTTSPRCSQRPSPCSRMQPLPTVPEPITSPGREDRVARRLREQRVPLVVHRREVRRASAPRR